MAQVKVDGTSQSSFADAAQDAARQIGELPGDEEVTFNLTHASVTIGGVAGVTRYSVALERVDP